jgi:hypothetical protein
MGTPGGIDWPDQGLKSAKTVYNGAKRKPSKEVYMWVFLGLCLLVILFTPIRLYLALFYASGTAPVNFSTPILFVLGIAAAQVVAVLLLVSAARRVSFGSHSRANAGTTDIDLRRGLLEGVLGALLLIKSFHSLYWLIVWDSTYDPFGIFWILLILLILLVVWAMIALVSPAKTRTVALLALVIMPLLVIAFAALAQRTDFRQLTAGRAERVSRAIEAYHAREARYPASLTELTSMPDIFLPGPVILFGETWCYDGGDDYFRLGYVDRKHWSDPNLFGHLHRGVGEPADLEPLCKAEIAALRSRDPGYFGLRQD